MHKDMGRRRFRAAGRQILCMALAGLIAAASPVTVMATNTAQAEKEKKEAQDKLDEANQKANQAKQQKGAAENVVEELQSELTMLISEISLLETDIEYKDEQIKQAQKDYDAAKVKEEEQYQAMKKRIRYMYEKGDTQYLDILLQVESMADLLNKSEYIADIYEYDRKMLTEYQQTKNQVQEYKAELENDKAEMEGMQIEYEAQKKGLELTIAQKRTEIANFDQQLAKAKQEAAVYTRTIAEKNQQIRQAEEEARKKAEEEARKKAEGEAKKAEEEAKKAEKEAKKAEEESKKAEEESRKAEEALKNNNSSGTITTNPLGESTSGSTYGPGGSSSGSSSSGSSSGPGVKSSGGSASGRAIADYGLQFVGNPYVYGGTSLTEGADCSGFVQSVYKHFGISLPRTSAEQRASGRGVEYADAQAGDLICYAGHVGIYIGNGQIVHASSPSTGIKVGNATYRSILAVRRIVE